RDPERAEQRGELPARLHELALGLRTGHDSAARIQGERAIDEHARTQRHHELTVSARVEAAERSRVPAALVGLALGDPRERAWGRRARHRRCRVQALDEIEHVLLAAKHTAHAGPQVRDVAEHVELGRRGRVERKLERSEAVEDLAEHDRLLEAILLALEQAEWRVASGREPAGNGFRLELVARLLDQALRGRTEEH